MNQQILENVKNYVKVIDVLSAVNGVTKFINDNLKKTDKQFKEILIKQASFGTLIGNMSDGLLPLYLTQNNNKGLEFTKGNDTKDADCMCLLDPFYNTEGKTTCNKNQRINRFYFLYKNRL